MSERCIVIKHSILWIARMALKTGAEVCFLANLCFFDCIRHFSLKLLCYCSSIRTIPVLKSNRSDTMKKKKINADAALLEVARRHHTTVEEVRKEIRLAMIAAMCDPDPAVQKRWCEIPHTGDTITPEDLITYIAKQCLPQ